MSSFFLFMAMKLNVRKKRKYCVSDPDPFVRIPIGLFFLSPDPWIHSKTWNVNMFASVPTTSHITVVSLRSSYLIYLASTYLIYLIYLSTLCIVYHRIRASRILYGRIVYYLVMSCLILSYRIYLNSVSLCPYVCMCVCMCNVIWCDVMRCDAM